MRDLLALAVVIIALAATTAIGAAVVSKTFNVSTTLVPVDAADMATMKADIFSSFTTLTGFLPVIVIAVIGSIAIYYVVNFLRGGQGGGL